ncbi:hypothetical protein [Nocardiopsis nanhaiensis]
MTTLGQLRKAALSHPEAERQEAGPGATAFTVRGTAFASADADGGVRLSLPEAEAAEALSGYASAETVGSEVRIPLADIDGQQLNHWVWRAWLHCAPEPLMQRALAAERAVPGEVGDLPRGIGRPATRALVGLGVTTLDQVAEYSEAELTAMHGVGPKAVRLLGEVLGSSGRGFRPPRGSR